MSTMTGLVDMFRGGWILYHNDVTICQSYDTTVGTRIRGFNSADATSQFAAQPNDDGGECYACSERRLLALGELCSPFTCLMTMMIDIIIVAFSILDDMVLTV